MKKIIIPAIAILLTAVSCDMLNTVPQSTLAPENYFKTETDLQLFSNTFYNNLLEKEPYEATSDLNTVNTLSSEMMGGDQRSVPKSGGGWSFTNIRKMNTLLEYIGNCDDQDAVDKYTGVTKFFRAYNYFLLVTRFGDVPWVDKQLASDSEQLYAPRDSREVVMGHIIDDLQDAIKKLPEEVSVYRVNKWTAYTLLAQVCLYEGSWIKYHANDIYKVEIADGGRTANDYFTLAADACKEVMKSGKYSLAPDYLTLFAEVDADKSEYILAIKNDFSLQIYNNSTAFATMPTQGCPGLTKKFVDSFLMKDGTRFTDKAGWQTMQFAEEVADRDPRLACIIRTPGYSMIGSTTLDTPDLSCSNTGYQIAKYVQDQTLEGVTRVGRSTNDMPVYRYAEVLLMYAEALAENTSHTLTQAEIDESVNVVRKRAGMPDLTLAGLTVDPYLTSKEYGYQNPILLADQNLAAIVEIRRERSIELALEGRRWNDLMRWAEGKCIEQPIYGMYFPEPDQNYVKDGKTYSYGEYDLDGDGVKEYCIYDGANKPTTSARFVLQLKSQEGVILTNGTSGYVIRQSTKDASSPTGFTEVSRSFNEGRDYLYPINSQDLSLNTKLTQNPGWSN